MAGELPPLPAGFTLDAAPGMPPLPPGFTLDAPAAPPQREGADKLYDKYPPSPFSVGTDESGQKTMTLPRSLQDIGVHTGWAPLDTTPIPLMQEAVIPVLSGAAEAARSIVSAPGDIGSGLAEGARIFTDDGSDTDKMLQGWSTDMANRAQRVRKNSIVIPTRGPQEALIAGATQYGAPGGAGAKIASKLGPMAQVVSTVLADLFATNPENASTFGDMADAGPTNIQPTDNPLLKRAKVAAEGPVAAMGTSAVANTVKGVKQLGSRFTEAGQRAAVGKDIREAGMTGEVLNKAVEDAAPLQTNGYKPTTADLVGTSKALEMQKGIQNSRNGQPLREQMASNADAIAKGVDQQLAQVPEQPGSANRQFQANREAEVTPLRENLTAAQQRQQAAQADLAAAQSGATAQARTAPAASADLDTFVREQKATDTAVKSGLYDEAARLGREVQVDPVPFAQNARALRDEIGPLAQGNMDLTAAIQDLDRLAPLPDPNVNGGLAQLPQNLTLADLIEMRPRLSRAISLTTGKMRGDATQRLLDIYNQIGTTINDMAASGNGAARAWTAAEDNYRTNFAPKYRSVDNRQTVGGKLDKGERTNQAVPATAVAGEFLKPSGSRGAIEATEDLQRIFQDTPNAAAAQDAARRYLVGHMADELGSGAIKADRATRWLDKYRDAVDAVPGVRQEVQQMINRLRAGEGRIGPLEEEIAVATKGLAEGESSFAKSPAGLWLDGDISKTVEAAMANPQKMEALMTAAERDPTGEAAKEVRNRVSEALNMDVRNTGATTGNSNAVKAPAPSEYKVSFDKVSQLLTNRDSRAALIRVYGEDGVKALDTYLKQLQLMARGKSVTAVAGSDTTMNNALTTAGEMLLKPASGIPSAAKNWVLRTIEGLSGSGAIAKLRVQAMGDPELARVLSMTYNTSTKNVIARKLLGYFVSKVPAMTEKTADKKPTP